MRQLRIVSYILQTISLLLCIIIPTKALFVGLNLADILIYAGMVLVLIIDDLFLSSIQVVSYRQMLEIKDMIQKFQFNFTIMLAITGIITLVTSGKINGFEHSMYAFLLSLFVLTFRQQITKD